MRGDFTRGQLLLDVLFRWLLCWAQFFEGLLGVVTFGVVHGLGISLSAAEALARWRYNVRFSR